MADVNLLVVLLPLIVIQLGLMIFALIDLIKREAVKGGKMIWAIIIVVLGIIGPVVYLLWGKER